MALLKLNNQLLNGILKKKHVDFSFSLKIGKNLFQNSLFLISIVLESQKAPCVKNKLLQGIFKIRENRIKLRHRALK